VRLGNQAHRRLPCRPERRPTAGSCGGPHRPASSRVLVNDGRIDCALDSNAPRPSRLAIVTGLCRGLQRKLRIAGSAAVGRVGQRQRPGRVGAVGWAGGEGGRVRSSLILFFLFGGVVAAVFVLFASVCVREPFAVGGEEASRSCACLCGARGGGGDHLLVRGGGGRGWLESNGNYSFSVTYCFQVVQGASQSFYVPSSSMVPTLHVDDCIWWFPSLRTDSMCHFIDKPLVTWDSPSRGKVVCIFHREDDPTTTVNERRTCPSEEGNRSCR
jgi:hypothetical protein